MNAARAKSSQAIVADADVLENEPLAPKTSIRVGGQAELFVRPRSATGLIEVLEQVRQRQMPLVLLGGGANTLVGDGGVTGVTLKIPGDLFPESVDLDSGGGTITLGAGAAIARLILLMKSNGLVGAEFLAGIPGTIGGALAMNAGTKMGECLSVVEAVEIATAEGLGWFPRAELSFEYRSTHLPAGGAVTRVRFRLPAGDRHLSQEKMDADLSYRKRTQPLQQPSFGSVFQNPPGDYAGRLIEAVGLKGHTIGRVQISSLHANWIVNLGGGKASEVVALMREAQERVRSETGIELKPEVRRVGNFI
jgi:UDP-N-acetylmuramate dehydrogenase